MKYLILLWFLVVFNQVTSTQTNNKEQTRKERKALRKIEAAKQDSLAAIALTKALESKQWVLEAYQIAGKTGRYINCNSSLNFVAIEGETSFIQIGNAQYFGQNGVGGISLKGTISKYEIKKTDNNRSYYVTIVFNSPSGTFDIRINSNATGEMANAVVQGNSSRQIRYYGKIVPIEESSVYKGQTRY